MKSFRWTALITEVITRNGMRVEIGILIDSMNPPWLYAGIVTRRDGAPYPSTTVADRFHRDEGAALAALANFEKRIVQ